MVHQNVQSWPERAVLARCLGTLVSPVCRSVPEWQRTADPLLGGRDVAGRARKGCDPALYSARRSGHVTLPSSTTRQRQRVRTYHHAPTADT